MARTRGAVARDDEQHQSDGGERRSHHELQRHVLRHRRQRDHAGAEREGEDEVDEALAGEVR